MLIEEYFHIALDQIRASKMRSFLTTLGIIIGVATVIFIVSILNGYKRSITKELNMLGANTFQVQREEMFSGIRVGDRRRKERKRIERELAVVIRENCDRVEAVGAEVWEFNVAVQYKDEKTNPVMMLAGGEPEFFPCNGYSLGRGRALTREDVRSHRNVVVLGIDAVEELFPFENPIGKQVKILGRKFEVIGVLEKMGSSTFGESLDNRLVIPITTFEDMLGRRRSCNLTVMAREGVDMQEAMDQVIGVLRKERKIPPGEPNDFSIISNDTLVESFNNIAEKITLGGIFLGLISLLVGSIGVMNIMLVTVTERTREIGIRKAVGARKSVILLQFLTEAVVLCLVGGSLGMLLGFGLAGLISLFLGIPFAIPSWAVISSLLVTSAVGIAAGLYPAVRAARLNPISALRYE